MPETPQRLQPRLLAWLQLEPGELRPTILLATYLMFSMAAVFCLKAVADAVFLSAFPASRLPYVDLAVTLLVGLAVNYYMRWMATGTLASTIRATQLFLAANLAVLWLLIRLEMAWAPPLIYVWVGIFSVLVPSQVWLLAGTVFTTRQAKRAFALIGSGGILGAGFAGSFTGFAVARIGTEAMLPVALICLLASGLAAREVSLMRPEEAARSRRSDAEPGAPLLDTLRLIRADRYLLLITVAIFLSTVVATLVKYEFKAIAQLVLEGDRDAQASFYGYFYGAVAVFSFLFHSAFTGRLLRWAGLSWCLFILPLGLMFGLGALLAAPALAAAILARGADQGFRHSVDRASQELLYVPVPLEIRSRVKSLLDIVVSRTADGAASIALLALLAVFGSDLKPISVVGLVCGAAWLIALAGLRREYVRTLRATIERPDIRSESLLRRLAEAGPTQELQRRLESSDPRDVEAALGWIQISGPGAAQAHIASLLTHPSAAIRRKSMHAVEAQNVPDCEREAVEFLKLETELEERWIALNYIQRNASPRTRDVLAEFLDSDDRELAAVVAAKLFTADGGLGGRAAEVFNEFRAAAPNGNAATRRVMAQLIARAPGADSDRRCLTMLLSDGDPAVVTETLRAVQRIRPADQVDAIMPLLGDSRFSREARRALAAIGDPAIDRLSEALRAVSPDPRLKRQAARALGAIGGPAAAAALLTYLAQERQTARAETLRALARIRRNDAQLRFDRALVERLVRESLTRFFGAVFLYQGLENSQPAAGFLRRAVHERLRHYLTDAFALLGLIYPQKEIEDALHRIESGRPELRANAVELLDSRLVGSPLRPLLLAAVEHSSDRARLQAGAQLLGLQAVDHTEALRRLLRSSDPWLQACACSAVAEARRADLRNLVADLREAHDPLLRETVSAALHQIDRPTESAEWKD